MGAFEIVLIGHLVWPVLGLAREIAELSPAQRPNGGAAKKQIPIRFSACESPGLLFT